jgi:hypothetical protein
MSDAGELFPRDAYEHQMRRARFELGRAVAILEGAGLRWTVIHQALIEEAREGTFRHTRLEELASYMENHPTARLSDGELAGLVDRRLAAGWPVDRQPLFDGLGL